MNRLLLTVIFCLAPHFVWAAFPVVAATTSSESSATSSHTVNLPSGISSGHLLTIHITCRNSTLPITFPAGWTQIGSDYTSGGVASSHNINADYYRIADGGEGATITVTTGGGGNACASVSNRITGHHASSAPEGGTPASATSANPNPPSLSPSWGAEDTLWIARAGVVGTRTTSVYPYPDGNANIQSSGSNTVTLTYCEQDENASSDDPGTFTVSLSDNWAAQTIAIRPAAAAASDAGSEAIWLP